MEAIDRSFLAREQMLTTLKYHLARATNRVKQQADKHKGNLQQTTLAQRSNQKMLSRCFGPYQVENKVKAEAYALTLSPQTAKHPIFHVSLLKRCPNPNEIIPAHPFEGWADSPAQETLIPEAILQRKFVKRRNKAIMEVLVK